MRQLANLRIDIGDEPQGAAVESAANVRLGSGTRFQIVNGTGAPISFGRGSSTLTTRRLTKWFSSLARTDSPTENFCPGAVNTYRAPP